MKTVSAHLYWLLVLIALMVVGDEWLKYQALQRLPDEGSLVDPGVLALAIHKNWGLAFDLPFRVEIIVFFSIVIGIGLLHIAYTNRHRRPDITFATLMIVLGSLGNLYDRIVYGFTVDYLILFARSAINLSDLVIVSGVVLLLISSRRPRRSHLKED